MYLSEKAHLNPFDSAWPLATSLPFTAAMAAAEGIRKHELRWMEKQRRVKHLLKNVYVVATCPDSTELRCEALRLVVPEDCVVVDRHAGWLLGAEMILAPNEHIELRPISMFRPSGHGRLRNDLALSGERNVTDDDVTEVHGIAVTTPIRTAWDLGRVRWTDQAIAGIDAMLRLGGFTHEEFLDGIERFRGMRWVTTLRLIGPLADGDSQSPGESVLRLRWIEAGIGKAVLQLEVWRGSWLLGILDLAHADLRYAAEYDGKEWHSSPDQQKHDQERRADIAEDDWLIDVFLTEHVFGRAANAQARLRQGAAEAARRLGLHAS